MPVSLMVIADLVETCRVSGEEALRFLSTLAADDCRAQASTHDVQTQLKHLLELAQVSAVSSFPP